MRRRVSSPVIDPRQAELPIERASEAERLQSEIIRDIDAALRLDAQTLAHALAAGRMHVGLAAAAATAERLTGEMMRPALRERVIEAFYAERLAIDHATQAISTWIPALPRAAEVRGRVEWQGAILAAETHEPKHNGAPAIVRDADGEPVYLYRDPSPVIIVRGIPSRDAGDAARARGHLLYAIGHGLITRARPHRS